MKVLLAALLTILSFLQVNGQYAPPDPAGFEGLIIEPYYVADADDAANLDGGPGLTAGTKVYRVYADMLPGYKLITVGGFPGYPMTLNTTTTFYNNEDRGEAWGRDIPANNIDDNTVAIDSWLTFGAATNQHWGVLKSEDPDGSIVGGPNNNDGLLVNQDNWAGIALTEADGLYGTGTNPPQLVSLGDAPTCFDPEGASAYSNDNFAWSVLGGIEGPTETNRILIAQFATNGDLSFCLNLTVKIPTDSICDDPNCHNFMEFLANLQPADTVGGGYAVQNKFYHPSLCFNSATAVIDCEGVVGGPALPGTACDDGIEGTTNDTYTEACVCAGDDCLGEQGGSALPGTTCDDGNELTDNDTWSTNCECLGLPTGIEERTASAGFRADPNPTDGLLRLTFATERSNNARIEVRNGIGQLLLTEQLGTVLQGQVHVIDLTAFTAGTYFITVMDGNGSATLPVQRF